MHYNLNRKKGRRALTLWKKKNKRVEMGKDEISYLIEKEQSKGFDWMKKLLRKEVEYG